MKFWYVDTKTIFPSIIIVIYILQVIKIGLSMIPTDREQKI